MRQKFDPVSKNIIQNQNPIALLLKDVKHFDAQNQVIGSLIREVDIGKKIHLSKFLDKAVDIRGREIRSRLDKLCGKDDFLKREMIITTAVIVFLYHHHILFPPEFP